MPMAMSSSSVGVHAAPWPLCAVLTYWVRCWVPVSHAFEHSLHSPHERAQLTGLWECGLWPCGLWPCGL